MASKESAAAKVTASRLVAYEILKLVGEGKGHSDELLYSTRMERLSPEDKNLAMALVMGVLRWQIALDARIRPLLQRPEQRLAEPVALALRMGAFQLLHMDRIPAHAALSESVELCRVAGEPHAAGMVNAVLRKLTTAKPVQRPLYESVEAFSERLAHPRWMVERWAGTYGRDAAMKICEADQREPMEGVMFAEAGGDWPRMDDGSRLVAELTVAASPNAATVWDCCAAPGGKTLVLARRLDRAELVASDVSERRLAHTEARIRRDPYAGKVSFRVADAADTREITSAFDLILCDVPCSGTGTLAHNPEIRHRLVVGELGRQAERQKRILTGALKRLAPGGRLLYSTCSLEPEECEQVVDVVADKEGLQRVPMGDLVAELKSRGVLADGVELESAVRGEALRTLPGVHGCDGFFAVVLERK